MSANFDYNSFMNENGGKSKYDSYSIDDVDNGKYTGSNYSDNDINYNYDNNINYSDSSDTIATQPTSVLGSYVAKSTPTPSYNANPLEDTDTQNSALNNYYKGSLDLARENSEWNHNFSTNQWKRQSALQRQQLQQQAQAIAQQSAFRGQQLQSTQNYNNQMLDVTRNRNNKLNELTDAQKSLIAQQVSSLAQQQRANDWAFNTQKNEYNRMSALRDRLTNEYKG